MTLTTTASAAEDGRMIIFGNAKIAAAGLALSAAIFFILYLSVIKPSTDTRTTR